MLRHAVHAVRGWISASCPGTRRVMAARAPQGGTAQAGAARGGGGLAMAEGAGFRGRGTPRSGPGSGGGGQGPAQAPRPATAGADHKRRVEDGAERPASATAAPNSDKRRRRGRGRGRDKQEPQVEPVGGAVSQAARPVSARAPTNRPAVQPVAVAVSAPMGGASAIGEQQQDGGGRQGGQRRRGRGRGQQGAGDGNNAGAGGREAPQGDASRAAAGRQGGGRGGVQAAEEHDGMDDAAVRSKHHITRGITRFTAIQSRTIQPAIQGMDVLAKAKTGSGKTLAFLIPMVEMYDREVRRSEQAWRASASSAFPFLVMTPTRELAIQIARNAEFLARFHRGFTVLHVIGGTNVDTDRRKTGSGQRCDLLVGTPGRINDLMGFPIGGGKGKGRGKGQGKNVGNPRAEEDFRRRLENVRVLVLDEADRMVERGFLQQVSKVKNHIRPGHQTLMFSATIPEDLGNVRMLRDGHAVVDVVGKAMGAQTNAQVEQKALLAPVEHHVDVLVDVIESVVADHRAKQASKSGAGSALEFGCGVGDIPLSAAMRAALDAWEIVDASGFRVMIFAPCNHYVDYIAAVLSAALPYEVLAIHGNLTQGKRTRAYDAFLTRGDTILVTSDASARGLDFPDVSAVVQLGFNARAEYIHRVGRTGRAGKGGLGVVILDNEVEASVLSPSSPDSIAAQVPRDRVEAWRPRPGAAPVPRAVSPSEGKHVLRAWVGAYAGRWKALRWDPYKVASMCERFARGLGLGDDPSRAAKIREKLHI